jgi:mannose-1-phosphate guanylyltransferase
MNALLLAAGHGKRLMNYTRKTPKCLLPVYGKPLLNRWIELLNNLGIKKILINTHFKSQQVRNFLKKHKAKDKIKIVHEKKLLGSAKTIFKNISFFENDALIIHADNYIEDDLKDFLKFHEQTKKKRLYATIFAFKSKNFRKEGILEIDKKRIFKNLYEKKKINHGTLANGAIYILTQKGLKFFEKKFDNKKDFTKNYLPIFINKSAVYLTKSHFDDIGSEEVYEKYI